MTAAIETMQPIDALLSAASTSTNPEVKAVYLARARTQLAALEREVARATSTLQAMETEFARVAGRVGGET